MSEKVTIEVDAEVKKALDNLEKIKKFLKKKWKKALI